MKPVQPIGKKLPPRRDAVMAHNITPVSTFSTDAIVAPKARDRLLELIQREQLPSDVRDTLAGALSGDLRRQQLLFQAMMDTWPRLQKNISEVVGSVSDAPWEIKAWSDHGKDASKSSEDKACFAKDAIKGMMPRPQWGELSESGLTKAIAYGYFSGHQVCEVLWDREKDGTKPRTARILPPRFYGYPYDIEGDDRLMLNRDGGYSGYDYEDFPEHHFLIAINGGHPGHASVAAPLRALTGYWLAAVFGLKWLLQFSQLYGIPFRWATYSDDSVKSKVCDMLESIGAAGWAAFPQGTSVNFEDASKSASALPQKDLMEMADAQADTFILGQTLTTDVGDSGSRALGDVHENVRIGMMQRVADFVADVYNHQLIPSIIELNYGDASELPCYKATFKQPQDEAKMVSRDKTLFLDMKLPVSKTYLYDRYGVPVPDEDSDDLFLPPEGQGGGAGDLEPGGDITAPPKGGTSDRENRLLSLWAQRMLRLADQLRRRGQDSKADKIETEVFDKMGLADMDVDEIKGSIVMANCGTGKGGFKLGNSCAKGDKNLEKSTKTGENTNHERTGKQSKNGNSGRQAGERGENEIERAIREAIGTGSGGGRYQQIQEQRESLRKLGEENPGLVHEKPAASDVAETGEHVIQYRDGRAWKYTKGDQYGLVPVADTPDMHDMSRFALGLAPATPAEYLQRNNLHNGLFADDIRIEGVTHDGGLVISQPLITGGPATRDQIASAFSGAGFVPVPDEEAMLEGVLESTAWYHPEKKIFVADARPSNVLLDQDSGKYKVIDVMIAPEDEHLARVAEKVGKANKPRKREWDFTEGRNHGIIKAASPSDTTSIDRLASNALQDLTGVTKEWLAPVRPHFERLAALAMSKHVSDDDFIHALEKSQKDMPELFDKLNVEALQTAFEESIGTAMLAGSVSRYEGEQVEAGSWVTLDDGRKVFLDNPHTVPDQGGSGTGGSNPIGKITKLENGKTWGGHDK